QPFKQLQRQLECAFPRNAFELLFETPKPSDGYYVRGYLKIWPIVRACVYYQIWLQRADRTFRVDLPFKSPLEISLQAAGLIKPSATAPTRPATQERIHQSVQLAQATQSRLVAQAIQPTRHLTDALARCNQHINYAVRGNENSFHQSAIAIAKNPGHHERTKHISTKYHFVRDQVDKGRIQLRYCPTKLMIADILTKAIPREQFEILRSKMGLADGPTN
ncbi:hypothetical protein As57867_019460, partial [Aphanomyces stellatus]